METGLGPNTRGDCSVRYRKLQVVIEAFQLPASEGHWKQIPPDCLWFIEATITKSAKLNTDGTATIKTLEGKMTANPGDWIIKGVNGEIYPCKPDIFAKTYEPAADPPLITEADAEFAAGMGAVLFADDTADD